MLAKEQPARPRPRDSHPRIHAIRSNSAVIVLGLVCALALVECIAAFMQSRAGIEVGDWEEVEQLLAEHEGEPLIVASRWLEASARMQLGAARSWDAVAYPDLRYEHFWLLSHERERPWTGALVAELEGLPEPTPLEVHAIGDLRLHRYEQSSGALRFSLLESVETVRTKKGSCSGGPSQWVCKLGRVAIRTLEIDYRPRRCLAFEFDDGVVAEVELGEVELGDRIHGHVGFGDFNARLRADPTARVELLVDGVVAGRWLFSDDQGWAAFAMQTPPGRHQVGLRASSSVGGTWQREGHRNSPTDTLCIELRGFDAGDVSPGGPNP